MVDMMIDVWLMMSTDAEAMINDSMMVIWFLRVLNDG